MPYTINNMSTEKDIEIAKILLQLKEATNSEVIQKLLDIPMIHKFISREAYVGLKMWAYDGEDYTPPNPANAEGAGTEVIYYHSNKDFESALPFMERADLMEVLLNKVKGE